MNNPISVKSGDGRTWVVDGRLVYGADAEVATWVNMRLGGGAVQTLFIAIGVLKDGIAPRDVSAETLPDQLGAGAYFFNHQAEDDYSDLSVSVAADDITTATPDIFQQILNYPFGQLGCRRISAEIDLSNERAVRQAQKLGFKLEGRKRRMAPKGGDVGVFGLLHDECPFWRPRG